MIIRNRIIGTFRTIFEQHGYEPIDTPALEYVEVLTGKAGENEKLMYHFEDRGGRQIGLRYDLTVPLARFVAMHQIDVPLPFKRYHIAPVWRAENPQRGRFREFWQCDADIVGSPSMLADAEGIAIAAEALAAVGLGNVVLHISHRQLLASIGRAAGIDEARSTVLYRAIDKLDKVGPEGVRRELESDGIDSGAVANVLDAVQADGAPLDLLADLQRRLAPVPGAERPITELQELFAILPDFGVPAERYRLDLSLARGLDYYTGPVFEAKVVEPRVGSVAGAGRYDDLIGTFLGRPIPATGLSLGLERIIEVVVEHELLDAPSTTSDVAVVPFPDTIGAAARLASQLRERGLRTDLSLLTQRGLGEQLKAVDRKGIPFAIIVGADELAAGQVTLKRLETGAQQTLTLEDAATSIRRGLSSTATNPSH
jgi:histidyl-tRNA synthetase